MASRISLWLIWLAALVFTGCTTHQTPFFPIRENGLWEYTANGRILQKRMIKIEKENSQTLVEMEWEVKRRPLAREQYQLKEDGIYLQANQFAFSPKPVEFKPPKPLLLFEKKRGRWVWKGKILTSQGALPANAEFRSLYPVNILIQRKSYKTAQVTEKITLFFSDGQETMGQRYYFSEREGLVRFENQIPGHDPFVADLLKIRN